MNTVQRIKEKDIKLSKIIAYADKGFDPWGSHELLTFLF
jgi:hypothetical protein